MSQAAVEISPWFIVCSTSIAITSTDRRSDTSIALSYKALRRSLVAHCVLAFANVSVLIFLTKFSVWLIFCLFRMSGAPSLYIDGIHIFHGAISLAAQTLFYGASYPIFWIRTANGMWRNAPSPCILRCTHIVVGHSSISMFFADDLVR